MTISNLPRLGLGIGWRPEIALAIDRRPDLGFIEVTAEDLDADALPGLDRNAVEVAHLRISSADDYTRNGDCLGGFPGVVVVRLHDLRQVIDAKEAEIGEPPSGGQSDGMEPDRRILGYGNTDAQPRVILPVVVFRGNRHLGGKARPHTGGLGQIGPGQREFQCGAPLNTQGRWHGDVRRLRIRLRYELLRARRRGK